MSDSSYPSIPTPPEHAGGAAGYPPRASDPAGAPQAPQYQPPQAQYQQAQYQQPQAQYQQPPYQAPVGAYQVPVGGYAPAPAPAPRPKGSPALGLLALGLSLIAAVACSIVIGITGWEIGYRLPGLSIGSTMQDLGSLSLLSPVRDQVLWAEVSLWVGTGTGIAAIVLGIIAIVKRRGLGTGITALIFAVLGPIIYFTVASTAFATGAAAGALATIA